MRLKVIVNIGLASLVLCALVGAGSSQVTTATLYTLVTDQTNAVIPDATVTLENQNTGIRRQQITDPTGECAFVFIPVGTYVVTIGAPGFKTLTASGLRLDAGQNVRRKFTLDVGQVLEQVAVSAEAPLVNTVSAEQLETQKWEEISELPILRRRASDLFTISTAIQRTGGSGNTTGSFVMNGLGRGGANLTLDGVQASGHPATPQAGLRGGFNYIEIVSLEAIEEVDVTKGPFSAEYSNTLSGNINVITKSGTNDLHGSLFHAINTEELNARPALLRTKPGLTFNQFGGSLGGPIIKDKVFVFGVYEGYRDRRFTTHEGEVPTERLRRDMVARFPEYQLILDQFALPNQPHDPDGAVGRVIVPAPFNANEDHLVVKPDAWLTDNAKITATWLRARPDRLQPLGSSSPGPNSLREFIGQIDRLTWAFTTFGSDWSSETRVGRHRVDNDRNDQFIEVRDPNKEESRFGGRRLSGIIFRGVQKQSELNFVGNVPQWVVEEKVALHRGQHSLKFGGLWNARGFGGANIENPTLRYNTEEELLNNTPVDSLFTFGVAPYLGRAHSFGLFVQDDWKVSPKLVLNLGLRWDWFGAMRVKGLDGSPAPALFNPGWADFFNFVLEDFDFPNQQGYKDDTINLGPRFGFAYNLDGNGKTVLRGGFGVMHIAPNLSIFEQTMINGVNDPFRTELGKAELERLNIRFPAYPEDVLELVRGGGAPPAFQLVDPELDAHYAMNYTFGFQRALTATLMLETGYVGTRGLKLTMQRNYNQPDPATGIRRNQNLGQARYWDNSDSSVYNSWQTSLRKRYSRNLAGSVHYVWQKALSYNDADTSFGARASIQEFFDIQSNRGRARDIVQHSFVSSFVYDLPIFAGSKTLLRNTIGGWQASGIFRAQSGEPITIDQGSARRHSRPDNINFGGSYLKQGDQWLNPAAFARVPISPASGQTIRPGSAGNNDLDAPGQWNLDFSLAKNFTVREGMRFQFRADMLNVFNHIDPASISTRIDRGNFGQITGFTEPRAIQFHLRLSF